MQFLKLNNQHYVRHDAIIEVVATGREGDCQVMLVTTEGDRLVYKRYKQFPEAESQIAMLIQELEACR